MISIRSFAIAAVAATGLTTAAIADDDPWFLDNDGTPGLSLDEFNAGYDKSGDFDRMDADKDGMLSREEMNNGMFMRSDRNRDGSLDADETSGLNDAIQMGNPDGQ